jgi:large subunit ribosomal protein L19
LLIVSEEVRMKARGLTKETIMELGTSTKSFPDFTIGDNIEVGLIVKEGEKERLQAFCGDVIAFHRNGSGTTFTVRKIGANGVGVERILPLHSPAISTIKILKKGNVRRAKLFYVRNLVGKAAKIQEKILTKEQKQVLQEKNIASVKENAV